LSHPVIDDMAQSATPQVQQPPPAPAKPPSRPPVTGVVPPSVGEAMIREVRPTLLGIQPGAAALGSRLVRTVFLAPLGWLIQGPLFALKFGPFFSKRYTLTNRRLRIRHGLKGVTSENEQVLLREIDDVRFDPDRVDPYYLSGDLEVVAGGKVLRLAGVPEPAGFRHAILNAVKAWEPEKAKGPWIAASADVSGQAART
jgi:hypothetical protein